MLDQNYPVNSFVCCLDGTCPGSCILLPEAPDMLGLWCGMCSQPACLLVPKLPQTGISMCIQNLWGMQGQMNAARTNLSQHCHIPPRLPGVYWESVILGFQPSAAGTHTAHPSHCSPPHAPSTGHLGHTCNHVYHHGHDGRPIRIDPESQGVPRLPDGFSRLGRLFVSLIQGCIFEAYWHCLTMMQRKNSLRCMHGSQHVLRRI